VLRTTAIAATFLSLLAAGCGEDDDDEGGGGGQAPKPEAALAADLTVIVSPEGPGGPVRERRVECERLGAGAEPPVCRGLTARLLTPVPRNKACTAIYGGPSVARVSGTLRGEPVEERFSLEDGCQIARWERNRALLGPAGRGP
jgi:hypothetical protein